MIMKNGITIAGTTLLDTVKNIETYPKIGMLVKISDIKKAVGGCVPNVSIDLAKIDSSLPLEAIAKIGKDENGAFILSELNKFGINTDKVLYSETEPTGFCDVMSVEGGERTFFLKEGANADFYPNEIDISLLNCRIFHIGYIFLLDKFDKIDDEYGTALSRFLGSVQKRGIKTSLDVVSDSSGNYGEKIIPALKYCDYFIVNEIECCKTWEINPYSENGILCEKNVKEAMVKSLNAGVGEKVIVHCKEASFCLDKSGAFTRINSLNIPASEIKGTVGAGDAFCAGCLYALYNGFSDEKTLNFASAAAACNLFEANSTDGMKSKEEIFQIMQKYKRL